MDSSNGSSGFGRYDYPSDGDCFREWVDDFQRVVVKLDTMYLKNGNHTLGYSFDGYQGFYYSTAMSFKSYNIIPSPFSHAYVGYETGSVPLMDSSDSYFGKPFRFQFWWSNKYSLVPATVSLSVKRNGDWISLGNARLTKYWLDESKKYYQSKPITLSAETWIRVSVHQGGKTYNKSYLVKPMYFMDSSYPSKVIVGKLGTAKFQVLGLKKSNCGVQVIYRNFQGKIVKVEDYAVKLVNGVIRIQAKLAVSGTVKGFLGCYPTTKQILSEEFEWDVTYG
jgi:hypothetical protein